MHFFLCVEYLIVHISILERERIKYKLQQWLKKRRKIKEQQKYFILFLYSFVSIKAFLRMRIKEFVDSLCLCVCCNICSNKKNRELISGERVPFSMRFFSSGKKNHALLEFWS